ncbi:hypothetical protein PCE1_001176 [Barthelona sp. PCE]
MSLPKRQAPRVAKTKAQMARGQRLFVVIEAACIETVRTERGYELLSVDRHRNILHKAGRDPAEARPDVVHRLLLALLDSPLNKAGKLQVFIHTQRNVLIYINPVTRIPRTFNRFASLMVQCLDKMKIRSPDGDELMRVIKNPITDHLPPGCMKIGTSHRADTVDVQDFVMELPDESVAFIIGGLAKGKVEVDYLDTEISISEYPLSASIVSARITGAFERKFGIL